MKSSYKQLLLIIILILTIHPVLAQDGSLFLTNFDNEKAKKFQNWSIIQDKDNNMLFANRKGIMKFNGEEWELIPTPSMPYKLFMEPKTQTVFVGCSQDYGYLSKDKKGFYHYNSLGKDTLTPGEFSQIEYVDSVIYFMSENYITRFDPKTLQHKKYWYAEEDFPFTGIIHNKDHVFINVWNKGLHRLQSDTLFPIVSGFYVENNEIIFNIPYNEERILLATDDNKLYLFDGMKFYHYRIKQNGYLEESIVSGALSLSDSAFAFSTLAGGVVIINKNRNEIQHTINYQNGLPDDEVFTLGSDKNGGLWIGHDKGITRADLSLPVRNYSTYPGLKGNIINAIEKDSTLYVASGEGLYYLTEEKEYEKRQVTVKVRQQTESQPVEQEVKKEEKKEDKPKRFVKKFFNKIFKSEEEKEEEAAESETEHKSQQKTRYSYRQRNIYSLQSISHKYKKVEGLEGKCEHLVHFGDTIIAGTNYGLYYIDNENKANSILQGVYIYQIIPFREDKSILFATKNGIMKAKVTKNGWETEKFTPSIREPIYSLALNKKTNTLWAGGNNKAYQLKFNWDRQAGSAVEYSLPTNYSERYYARTVNEDTYLFLSSGIYTYEKNRDTFRLDAGFVQDSSVFKDFEFVINQDDITWLYYQDQWQMLDKKDYWNKSYGGYLELFNNVDNIYISNTGFMYVIASSNIYRVNLKKDLPGKENFKLHYTQIKKGKDQFFSIGDFKIDKETTSVEFKMAAPHYIREGETEYQYIIEGLMNEWSEWTTNPEVRFFSRKGNYTLRARARNIWGQVSESDPIKFQVPPPFTDTTLFFALVAAGAIVLVFMVIKMRERKLRHDKEVLEQKVKIRTKTIEEQKDEIETQRDEILEKKNDIQKKNEEITDSIEYASRIQSALLPLKDHFYKAFEDHFILFRPRDIVSGDFYWIYRKNSKIYVTAADCTGHGVPGAFMSMLGISFLNEIVSHDRNGVYNAADILNNLRVMVKNSLHQDSIKGGSKDGMDMAFCIIDKKKKTLDYAGAFNPLIYFKNGDMEVIKADRMPVGVYVNEKESFTNHQIKIDEGDAFYIFSDGYVDQFGGPKGKKFKMKSMKSLLEDIHDRNMEEQLRMLNHNFDEWKGDQMQVDDVILIGVRI